MATRERQTVTVFLSDRRTENGWDFKCPGCWLLYMGNPNPGLKEPLLHPFDAVCRNCGCRVIWSDEVAEWEQQARAPKTPISFDDAVKLVLQREGFFDYKMSECECRQTGEPDHPMCHMCKRIYLLPAGTKLGLAYLMGGETWRKVSKQADVNYPRDPGMPCVELTKEMIESWQPDIRAFFR